MNSETVLKVENISKKFCRSLRRSMSYGAVDVFKSSLGIKTKSNELRKDEFWALKDISFEVKKGETLGVVGENGSGKSTLLRIIHGIYPMDSGSVSYRGRMAALIAVGAGFHPHYTGRENIFLNGAILGMTKGEIQEKFDRIIEFAEIGEFIDSPVATYSSGMKVRLGFSIAIHTDIEILLADEILAVGDVNFQRKCFQKIIELKRQGVAVLFVSHSIPHLESICNTGLFLHHGRQVYYGPIRECVSEYIKVINIENKNKTTSAAAASIQNEVGVGNVLITNAYVYEEGKRRDLTDIEFGKNIIVEFDYYIKNKNTDDYQVRIGFKTYEGINIQKFYFQESKFPDGIFYSNEKILKLNNKGKIKFKILNPRIFPQSIKVDIGIKSLNMGVHEGGLINACAFNVIQKDNLYFQHGFASITEFDYQCEVE